MSRLIVFWFLFHLSQIQFDILFEVLSHDDRMMRGKKHVEISFRSCRVHE